MSTSFYGAVVTDKPSFEKYLVSRSLKALVELPTSHEALHNAGT
jgi:hypothetical protein